MKVLCLLASLYSMPSGPAVGKPGAELSARIEAAMTSLQATDSDEVSRAVRTLALIGEPALPFVVKRLNEAEAGERLLLLAAVSRIPRAAPLLETAKKDPHLVVRAWVTPPRRAPGRTLAEHAKRYLDILALSEKHKRDDVAEDLRELTPDDLERYPEFFEEEMRERMKDRRLAREIHKRRRKAALEFAEAGARELVPRKGDPIFVAYLALLREENEALHRACTTLVLQGEAVAPHLEALLEKESYEPRVVVGLLRSVRADKGVGLYARIDELRVGVQQLLVSMSRAVLGPDAERMAAKMALSEDPAVRVAALDVLLDLPAPAGRIVARKLLDVSRFVQADFSRATKLLVRTGDEEDLKLLVELATLVVPRDGTNKSQRLVYLRSAAMTALRKYEGPHADTLGRRLLEHGAIAIKSLGIHVLADGELLAERVREEKSSALVVDAVKRLLELDRKKGEEAAVATMRRGRGVRSLADLLARAGSAATLVSLLDHEDWDISAHVLKALSRFDSLPAEFSERLLRFYDAASQERRAEVLHALLPLGGDAVRRRFLEAGDAAFSVMLDRAIDKKLPFSVPLVPYLEGADASRRKAIATLAAAMPEVEPGLFVALLEAWEASFKIGDTLKNTEGGAQRVRTDLFKRLAWSKDTSSARTLFDALLKGEERDETKIVGTFKAAAQLLPGKDLVRVLPRLQAAVRAEYPLDGKMVPPDDRPRELFIYGAAHALGWTRAEGALDALCAILLDPKLQPEAYEEGTPVAVWAYILYALRHYPADKVGAAFARALRRADDSGDLAGMEPAHLFRLVQIARGGRDSGRGLYEVSLLLLDVLDRLPWEGEVHFERMIASGGRNLFAEAAAAARRSAERRRRLGFRDDEGRWSARRLEFRARLYEGLVDRKLEPFQKVLDEAWDDPMIVWLAGWYLATYRIDLALAQRVAERAVQLGGRLRHRDRDILAAVRVQQKRPKEALALLDMEARLPVKRPKRGRRSGRHLLLEALARLQLGDRSGAAFALETALLEDRRLIPVAKSDPALKPLQETVRQADVEFFDTIFRLD